MSYVYVILNTRNGKLYVGWTNDPSERWRKHRKNANLGMHYFLYRAMRKEFSVFEFKVIATYHSDNEAMLAEKYWVQFFQSSDDCFGYNMTEGGEGCVLRGIANPMFGKRGQLSPNFGRKILVKKEDVQKRRVTRRRNLQSNIDTRICQAINIFVEQKLRRGSIKLLSLMWCVSHTQVRRFLQQHLPQYITGVSFSG